MHRFCWSNVLIHLQLLLSLLRLSQFDQRELCWAVSLCPFGMAANLWRLGSLTREDQLSSHLISTCNVSCAWQEWGGTEAGSRYSVWQLVQSVQPVGGILVWKTWVHLMPAFHMCLLFSAIVWPGHHESRVPTLPFVTKLCYGHYCICTPFLGFCTALGTVVFLSAMLPYHPVSHSSHWINSKV